MKKKTTMALLGCMITSVVWAQAPIDSRYDNIDWDEDTMEIVTVNDVLMSQQTVAAVKNNDLQLERVWSNRKFTNISYSLSHKMTSSGQILTSTGLRDLEYEAEWGLAVTRGKNFLLHRRPIGNVLSFYIDYVGFDFSVNHFDYADDCPLFDPTLDFTDSQGNTNRMYTPWDFKKYNVSYGMRLGPSVTLAPFANTNSGMRFLKLNLYAHFGYNVSVCYIEKDSNNEHTVSTSSGGSYYDDAPGAAFNIAHGVYNAFGLNLSWKKVGVGYETRSAKYKYKPIDNKFGKDKYNFKETDSRIYLQVRW